MSCKSIYSATVGTGNADGLQIRRKIELAKQISWLGRGGIEPKGQLCGGCGSN
jgi:hypothetical protein